MNVLILGAGGFIGSHLTRAILDRTGWHVCGLDLHTERLTRFLEHPRLTLRRGDLHAELDWIEHWLTWADVCLPLAATATPATYVRDPLGTFDLDFLGNLEVVRRCARSGTRVVFPSTSEVYGMSSDEEFDEYTSHLVCGPTATSRWIYASSKQLLDRVIHALAEAHGLRFTLFRPFNWVGPGQDDLNSTNPGGTARLIPQLLGNLVRGESLTLVDGGQQRRCFTYIDDGIDALMQILANPSVTDGQTFNIGHPGNERSVLQTAQSLIETVAQRPHYRDIRSRVELRHQSGTEYYGHGYQDIARRVPAIHRARTVLGWSPHVDFDELIESTVHHYLGPASPDGASQSAAAAIEHLPPTAEKSGE